jgi:4-alpha-glucanotransferase
MRFERTAGILLHPTSLPSPFGIGDLGNEAYRFIDFLYSAGQKLWQVFPLGPTGYGDSPYQCFSAFAGNPLLISPQKLKEESLLTDNDLSDFPKFNPHQIDFGAIIDLKYNLLKKAFAQFKTMKGINAEFINFCEVQNDWLDDFSLFMAAKDFHNGKLWTEWDKDLVLRRDGSLKIWREKLSDEITFHKFIQFKFYQQWKNLKDYVNSKGIKIIGDMPIFIAYDSADLWSHKELFTVDEKGNLKFVAGVPPDYFSETGQRWGNPLFKWKRMENDEFLWWRRRLSAILQFVDIIRIDHFRGFDAYWEIPAEAPTAQKGRWVKAPGEKFFTTVKKYLGDIPIIAEDLGLITKSVTELREKFDFPGMKILQFAFGTGMETKFLPHNLVPNSIIYTGSHDNDTTRGYFEKAKQADNDIYSHAQKYLSFFNNDLTFELIRTAYASVADLVVIPLQDILNLGSDARMNFPGKLGGNWTWRFTWDQVPYGIADVYKEFTILYERPPKPKEKEAELEYHDE